MKIRWREHEFIVVTVLAISIVAGIYWTYFGINRSSPNALAFAMHQLHFNPYRNALIPDTGVVLLLYGAYSVFSREIIKKLLEKKAVSEFILQLLGLMMLVAIGIFTAVYFKNEWAGLTFPHVAWSFLTTLIGTVVFLMYIALREAVIASIQRSGIRQNYWTLVCNQFTAFASIYLIIPFVVAIFRLFHDGEPIALYFALTLPVFLVYMVNTYWVFPLTAIRPFFSLPVIVRTTLATFVCSIPFLLVPFHEGVEIGFFGCWLLLLFVATPLAWVLYQARKDKILQLRGVETALAKSTGDLQFLKSQINPHFLFNSLNTIYGFAIREEASHTAGGIQKLGDMMRFMLEENTKDRIPLDQEVEYLTNYISLQKMRIDTASDITVETQLDPACQQQQIAPMLLIPFVENAFKHGVSLDHRSWINIDLKCLGNKIIFEVRNSLHPAQDNDPEKGKKGIGNQNVIDRLDLLYPSTHSLRFSQSETEYTVNLTIQLKQK